MFFYEYMILFFLCLFVFCKLTCGRCYSKTCLIGKTAIITGGNSGVGYETALALASRGCRVIIADKDDSSVSRQKIIDESTNQHVISKVLDLRSLASVRKFAENMLRSEPRLDILIMNAGIASNKLIHTDDGIQITMQVNYLGHFLLTFLLLDLMKKSSPSRIIFTSSTGAYFAKFSLEDLNPTKDYPRQHRIYLNSKLCLILFARYLSMKLKGTNVTVNCVHPGGVRSAIYLRAFRVEKSVFPLILGFLTLIFGKSAEEGAQTTLHVACEKSLENVSGKFFIDCISIFLPYQAYDMQLCAKMVELSKTLVKLQPEECLLSEKVLK
ncbi:unnamed protein product [Diabrotica balteata]|uniref:Uncharacterized protein n=1 Tax=Diabrotica balteata TaxID=107213 RepID=A0A9N9XHX8_DIABA|nr:unnamed protein product [Diabrotica balteata]